MASISINTICSTNIIGDDKMKILIIGNNLLKIENLTKKVSDFYEIKSFKINKNTTKNEINNIVINNKDWIIEDFNENNLEVLFNLSEIVIFIDLKKNIFNKTINIDKEKIYNLLKKHIRKGIILKNNNEIKKYLKNLYENYNY